MAKGEICNALQICLKSLTGTLDTLYVTSLQKGVESDSIIMVRLLDTQDNHCQTPQHGFSTGFLSICLIFLLL